MTSVKILLLVSLMLVPSQYALAAIGCTLTNPAQDLKYLYPGMTSFRETAKNLDQMPDGARWYEQLRQRLGSDLDSVYETFATPYTVYTVFKGEQLIGVVHGVNVPGEGGVIQVFLSTNSESGEIVKFFYQRLESSAARALRQKAFRSRFTGLTLADFYKHDYYVVADPTSDKDRVGRIPNPVAGGEGMKDYIASLRGIRKNLILLDMFVYEFRNEPYYQRARSAVVARRK
jgi:hypothetical protein